MIVQQKHTSEQIKNYDACRMVDNFKRIV